MDSPQNSVDLGKVLQAGQLAKVSLYRRLLKRVAQAAPLSASELRMLRELGAELEEAAEREKEGDAPSTSFDRVSRSDVAAFVFRVSPQTISKWVHREGMPRNEDGTFCLADCVEWAIERMEEAAAGKEESYFVKGRASGPAEALVARVLRVLSNG